MSRRLLPHVDRDEFKATYALMLQFATTTGRFARDLPAPLRRQALPIYQRIMRGSLDALHASNLSAHGEGQIKSAAGKLRARARSS